MNRPYRFGGSNYKSNCILKFSQITKLMNQINQNHGTEFDAFLISRYKPGQGVSLHRDDEPIIDQGHPIYNLSCGATRTIKFYETKDRKVAPTHSFLRKPSVHRCRLPGFLVA